MPTVREIEELLFRFAPAESAMEWDNVGLLVGDPAREVRRVLVALDVTEAVAEEAAEGDFQLICAHHPLMNCAWSPVQNVRSDTPRGRLLRKLLRHDTAAICMHTNLDAAAGGVNDCLAAALGLLEPVLLPDAPVVVPGTDGICRMGCLPAPLPLEEFVRKTAAALHWDGIRYADAGRPVFKVAVGGGACGEYAGAVAAAGCDTFVTADVKYHGFQDALGLGLNLLDAGHFPTEDPVCEKLVRVIAEAFPGLEVRKSRVHHNIVRSCPALER